MAVTITDIRRGCAGTPCQHYRITIDEDGKKHIVTAYIDDLQKRESWPDVPVAVGIALLRVKRELDAGARLDSLMAKEVG